MIFDIVDPNLNKSEGKISFEHEIVYLYNICNIDVKSFFSRLSYLCTVLYMWALRNCLDTVGYICFLASKIGAKHPACPKHLKRIYIFGCS